MPLKAACIALLATLQPSPLALQFACRSGGMYLCMFVCICVHICVCLCVQGLSKGLKTGCPELGIVKFWGIL